MSLQCKEEKICLDVIIDEEDVANAIKILIDKGKILKTNGNKIRTKLDGELLIDADNENLQILF